MFKQWLKQFIALLLCIIMILSPISTVYADNYEQSGNSDDATYYILQGKDVESLFDFGIADVTNLASWILQFKTYTVIKKFNKDGNDVYKMYFNTPNLQSIVKNNIVATVEDGYTDDTYDVNETQWVVKVGKEASNDNVITRYGFQIPNYRYFGEYPKAVMSTAGILPSPKRWYESLWRAVKSLFGCSFLKAPDSDNFNTITYMNHTYNDKSDYIIEFFKKYYIKYFENKIPKGYVSAKDSKKAGEYFEGGDELISLTVTDEAYEIATLYNSTHEDEYKSGVTMHAYYDEYKSGKKPSELAELHKSDKNVDHKDIWHYFAYMPSFLNSYTSFVQDNPKANYIMLHSFKNKDVNKDTWPKGSTLTLTSNLVHYKDTDDYHITLDKGPNLPEDKEIVADLGADIQRYAFDYVQFHVTYKVQTRTVVEVDGVQQSDTGWVDPDTDSEMDVLYKDTEEYRDNPDYTKDVGEPDVDEDTDPIMQNGKKIGETTTKTTTYTRNAKYEIKYIWDGIDNTVTFPYDTLKEQFLDPLLFDNVNFLEKDFIPPEIEVVYKQYTANEKTINNYKKFNEMMARGDDHDGTFKSLDKILYRQCMITNEGKDKECWSKKYGGEKTTLTVANVYAYSEIYKITNTEKYLIEKHYNPNVQLTTADAHAIINKLQDYCGPYYTEVLSNMMKLMSYTAKSDGVSDPTNDIVSDDLRVMPFDTATLMQKDRANYNVTDPRVELYKTHITGSLVANPLAIVDTTGTYQLGGIGIYFSPFSVIINLAGKITEFSVFFQQICNFDLLDSYGLSPAKLWTNGFITLMMVALVLFFIIQTVIGVIKYSSKSGAKAIGSFVILVFELGFFTAFAANPNKVWDVVKNAESKIMNLGEAMTAYSNTNLTYLFGNTSDMEVMYYLPYLDTWSKYNTGYGLMEDQQLMDPTTDSAELVDFTNPMLGGNDIMHYSVLLADAFSYYGRSNSISDTVMENGVVYNGKRINNNAYRVVDHFMAPRVEVIDNGNGTLNIDVKTNENYNGQFQSIGTFVDLLVKLLNCIICCFLSLIKLMVFLYSWWVLYILVFRVILGKGAEGKSMKDILIETFAPTLVMIILGLFNNVIMSIGMGLSGIVGLILEIFIIWLILFKMIPLWKNEFPKFFPPTLNWIYMLTNLSLYQRNKHARDLENKSKMDSEDSGDQLSKEELGDVNKRTEHYFNEDGTMKEQYQNDDRYNKDLENWYRFTQNSITKGTELSENTKHAILNFENRDKYKDIVDTYRINSTTGKTNSKYKKLKK